MAVGNLFLNAILDLALYKPLGAAGIALSTAIVTTMNAAVLMVLLRRRVGLLHLTEVAGEAARIVVATVYCTAAAFGVWWPLDQILGRSLPAQIVSVGLALLAGGGAYLAAGRILQLSDMEVLVGSPTASRRGLHQLSREFARRPEGPEAPPVRYMGAALDTSATSRSSPTSTTASRRWPTASCS